MSLKEQLKEDLKTAMRDKEVVKRDSIRAINTMIKQCTCQYLSLSY